ncbi:YbaK/EbsC family protein [Blastococcus brunescens]|uniref:YbaK/EbsC family protein n=1 Tax=Blastococcus brunescens TaxID=1564165 RepID=A0ABZ1B5G4_9ACTN|nr:YbaK/EbsC family protein [Blastococcus sp. BMG 8361]WRL66058.1 YbaK/EbsC family protein [Blastococcus sp. BMG 8361]
MAGSAHASADPADRAGTPRVAEVARLLRAAGATGTVRHLPDSAPTAAAAAAQLGVPVGAIANSLVFDVDGNPLLVLTSGAHRVDEAVVATLLGVPRISRATPEFVRRHTGQAIGGVAPSATRSRSAPSSTSNWPATTRSGRLPGTRTPCSPRPTTSCSD